MRAKRYVPITMVIICLIAATAIYTLSRPVPQASGNTISVVTQHNDNARSGANLNETILNTANVNVNNFGKLFSRPVDGSIYTQPLYVAGVAIPNKGTHNVVFVGTMHDTVYAFDADYPAQSTPLWSTSLGPSVALPNIVIGTRCGVYKDISTEIGIIGTPVIDAATGTLYVVAFTLENGIFYHRLHALDITTGLHKANINNGQPKVISASVSGTGAGNVNGTIAFNSALQNQRPSLLLANGNVYIGFASYCDTGNYHGWLLSYAANSLNQVGVFNFTPNGQEGGVWQGGQGPSFDGSYIYMMVGNGDSDPVNGKNLGEAFVKLNPTNLTLVDWFLPYNYDILNNTDYDIGSSGPLVLPGSNMIVGGSKQGIFYLVNTNNMGHFHAGNDSQIVQEFTASESFIHGSPIYWNSPNGPRVYVWGDIASLKSFAFTGTSFNTTPVSKSAHIAPDGEPGGMISISANGSTEGSGIIWASLPYIDNATNAVVEGELFAYDATDLTKELWDSKMNDSRDHYGNFGKFVPPTIVNGKVYMSTFSNMLDAYGIFTPVTNANDNGQRDIPGTLSYTLKNASPGQTITFNPGGKMTINEPTTLVVPAGVSIYGGCTNGVPDLTINGASSLAGTDGLQLNGNTTINGLKITGYSGKSLVTTGTENHDTCTIAQK